MIRIRFTIRIDRPQPRQSPECGEPREVDVKGSYILDHAHQDEADESRGDTLPVPSWPYGHPDGRGARPAPPTRPTSIGFQRNRDDTEGDD